MLSKVLWNSLLVTPAILGAALISAPAFSAEANVSDSADALLNDTAAVTEVSEVKASDLDQAMQAAASLQVAAAPEASAPAAPAANVSAEVAPAPAVQAPVQVAQVAPAAGSTATPNVASLDQIMQYSNEGQGAGSLAQVTSVTQFSDVSPSDWAYEALSYLANSEELGGLDCLEGYPDGTYRGGRAMTRFEFAAGLASCLDALAGRLDSLDPEALARIEALQREFAAELATLRGRVDALEAAVAELEENQFSTTTVLNGRTIFSFSDIWGGDNNDIQSGNEFVFQSRVRLNFDTSFYGVDRLRTRLQAGNFESWNNIPSSSIIPNTRIGGDNFDIFGNQTDFSYDSNNGENYEVDITRLEYYFPVGAATFYIGAIGEGISDIVTTVSPFDDPEAGSLSYFGYNPIYDVGADTQNIGFGATYDFGDNLQLGAGYLSQEGNSPDNGSGLFNGGYTAFGQLTFTPGDLTVALTYVNSYLSQDVTIPNDIDGGVDFSGSQPTVFNAYGLSANYQLSDTIAIGGWISYIDSRVFAGPTEQLGDGRSWTYAGTLGIYDLGIEGSLLGLIVGVPPYNAIYDYAIGGAEGSDAALHIEAFYRFPLSDNILFTPGVIWVMDPGNNNDNDDVVIGALRTTFKF